ncbi:MAG TPA: hypothetical protein VFG23_24240 [Polyangia bacterium]|nr:hypothetical protein [Polyangia bacterium]
MSNLRMLAGCAAAAALIAPAIPARGDTTPVGARQPARFLSARAGVGLETPPGWSLSLHTGYPNVLCILVHPQGSRISVAVDRATAVDSTALLAENRPGLAAQGLTIDRVSPGPLGGVLVDARAPRHNQSVRQLYLVRSVAGGPDPRQAIVLTLTTTADQIAAASGALDWVMAHLDLRAPVRPDDEADRPDGGL